MAKSVNELTEEYHRRIREATVLYEKALTEASNTYYFGLQEAHSDIKDQVSNLIKTLASPSEKVKAKGRKRPRPHS